VLAYYRIGAPFGDNITVQSDTLPTLFAQKWRTLMKLTRNLGNLDRILRFAVGALLVVLTLMGTIGIWGWLGAILIVTAFLNFCPIYRILGLKTCSDC
jgi:O-antigen ligase